MKNFIIFLMRALFIFISFAQPGLLTYQQLIASCWLLRINALPNHCVLDACVNAALGFMWSGPAARMQQCHTSMFGGVSDSAHTSDWPHRHRIPCLGSPHQACVETRGRHCHTCSTCYARIYYVTQHVYQTVPIVQ